MRGQREAAQKAQNLFNRKEHNGRKGVASLAVEFSGGTEDCIGRYLC